MAMAYSRKRLYEQAMQVIEERNLFFIEDLVAFLPCDKTTFYRKFPLGCNEYNSIKRALETNKVRTKSAIRHRLFITSGGEKITKEPITIEIIDSRNQIEQLEEDDEK